MIKYFDMENATLESNMKSEYFKKFLNVNNIFLEKLNIQRFIINCEEQDFFSIIKIIAQYKNLSKLLFVIRAKFSKIPNLQNLENIVIENTAAYIKGDNIYNRIYLNHSNIDKIKKLLESGYNLIIYPTINLDSISNFNDELSLLFSHCEGHDLNLGGYMVSTDLMKEHPCNSYLCDGDRCHKKIIGLPRHLFIDGDTLNIYPHDLFYDSLLVGNIKKNSLENELKKYLSSNERHLFIKLNRKVFIKYLANYPYDFFPLIEYLKSEFLSNE